ncbi:hypothetical protein [Ellagibacter isourolithinifaciens]|uniref:hypothetical protein n=1 Tax=Ellagibacter isourolithinifaciens TaxID=2137581 RepID=UPI003A8E45CA
MKNKKAFDEHQLWGLVEELKSDDRITSLPLDTRQYVRYLLEQLDKRGRTTNAYYVRASSLDEMYRQLCNIRDWLPDYTSYIDSAVDECMRILASEWPANNGRQIVDIDEAVRDAFFADSEERIERARDAANKVEDLSRQFQEKKDEYEAGLVELKSSYAESIAASKTQLEKRRDELGNEFELEVKERADKATSSLAAVENEYKKSLDSTKSEVEQILDGVENTANSISGIAMTTDYAKYATDKEKAVRIYDGLAILFAIAGIALVAFALTGLHADATSASVFKLAVSVASFTVSGFLFKRGTYNQREAKAARRTELTLREYKPFIANLSEDDKREITNKIADRIFIKGEIGDKEEKTISNALLNRGLNDKDIASVAELLKAVYRVEQNSSS